MSLFIIFTCLFAHAPSAPPLEITVSLRPEQTEVPVPIAVDVTRHLNGQSGNHQLEEVSASGAKAVLCQISSEQNRAILRFIIPPAPSAQPFTKRFRLTRADRAASPVFRVEDLEGKHLRLSENGRPVFVFNYGMMLKTGVAEKYRRACYVHPLFDVDGVTLTDDFPSDHLHQRGMSWTWPIVKVSDSPKGYDIWSCEGAGQRFHRLLGLEVGPVCAWLGLSNGWHVGEKKIVDETVWLTVFRAGEVGRVMDVDITLTATEQPVTIGGRPGKGYGGFTIRFAPRQETYLHTSAGQLPERRGSLTPPECLTVGLLQRPLRQIQRQPQRLRHRRLRPRAKSRTPNDVDEPLLRHPQPHLSQRQNARPQTRSTPALALPRLASSRRCANRKGCRGFCGVLATDRGTSERSRINNYTRHVCNTCT